MSASSDGTARMWRAGEDGAMSCAAVLKDHSAEVPLRGSCWGTACLTDSGARARDHDLHLIMLLIKMCLCRCPSVPFASVLEITSCPSDRQHILHVLQQLHGSNANDFMFVVLHNSCLNMSHSVHHAGCQAVMLSAGR